MKFLSLAERAYVYNHLNRVRHITLDPNGPGAVRIHLVPCRKPDRTTPFVAILNGQDILPLQISWAILLACLMDALQPFAGKEISPADWDAVQAQAVAAARKRDNIQSALRMLKELDLKTEQGRYIQGLMYQYWDNQGKLLRQPPADQNGKAADNKQPSENVKGLGQFIHAQEQLEHWQQQYPAIPSPAEKQ